jgi:hypothetical protein
LDAETPIDGLELIGDRMGSSIAVFAACTDDSSSTPASGDAGTPDANTADTAAPPDAAPTCAPGLPPSGFVNLGEGESVGINADIVLAQGGAPVIAYTAPSADRIAINVVRWDADCGRWLAPITVDTAAVQQGGTSRQVSLAYDSTTGDVGVAYQVITAPYGHDEQYEIRFASIAKGANAASTPERVDDPTVHPDPDHGRSSPGLAMAGGKLFVAWHQAYRTCGTSGCDGIIFRSKAGGQWSAESVAPTTEAVTAMSASTAVAVDGNGAPAVAFLAATWSAPDHTEVDFWRPGGALTKAFGADLGTDSPNVSLAFAGTKPRVAAAIHLTDTWSSDGKNVWFAASDDGTTWSNPIDIPRDKGDNFGAFVGLTITGESSVAVVSDINSGDGSSEFGTPKIARTTDLSSFTTTGPAKSAFEGPTKWVRAAADANGKLHVAFYNPPGNVTVKTGLVYYRE